MRWRLPLLFLLLSACSRPSEEDCRRAAVNVQRILGLADSANPPDPQRAVRQCVAKDTKERVACLIAARTVADVNACKGQ